MIMHARDLHVRLAREPLVHFDQVALKGLFDRGCVGVRIRVAAKSERTGSPPASSICIIKDVPDRGSPETMVIISAFQETENSGGEFRAPPYLESRT